MSYIEELPSKYPDKVNLEELGRSNEDRPIYLITINRNNNSRKTEKPVIFIESGMYYNKIRCREYPLFNEYIISIENEGYVQRIFI